MRALVGATALIPDRVEKITMNILLVIPSEVEESRDVGLRRSCGVSRLRFAPLDMTAML